jgi:hypothetical protein
MSFENFDIPPQLAGMVSVACDAASLAIGEIVRSSGGSLASRIGYQEAHCC